MKKICAWCKTELESVEGGDPREISHGICPKCAQRLESKLGNPKSLATFLDRIDAPVLLVDGDVVAHSANAAARGALGKELPSIRGRLGGDLVECVYARLPEGCGQTVHCAACALRITVTATYRDGRPRPEEVAYLVVLGPDGVPTRTRIVISTEKAGPVVLLRIDQIEPCPA